MARSQAHGDLVSRLARDAQAQKLDLVWVYSSSTAKELQWRVYIEQRHSVAISMARVGLCFTDISEYCLPFPLH